MASSNAIREEYMSSLADLDQNSKPMIDMLTMLAEDHRQHAPIIVDAIKQRISQVRLKLPLLYLIDSIVKNVGEVYKPLFQQEIVGIFVDAFDKMKNDKVREKMFALRETWNDVFLQTKLYALDVKVNQIDPNWPIVAKLTKNPKIHVNPNFLKKIEPVDPIEQLQQELREKHRKLLELKNCKLELEMREMAKKIEEEQRKGGLEGALTTSTASGKSAKVSPVSSALLAAVEGSAAAAASGKTSRTAGKDKKESKSPSSTTTRKSSSTSPKSSSKSKSSGSHRSSSHHHTSSTSSSGGSGSKEKKRSSKRSSDDSTEKMSPKKRSRSSGSESVDGDKKAKHAAVMMKRIPKLSVVATGDTDERIVSTSASSLKSGSATGTSAPATNQKLFSGAAAMDVDLRQFVAVPSTSTVMTAMSKDGELLPKGDTDERELKLKTKQHSIGGGAGTEGLEDLSDTEAAAPFAKKFDLLFGSNDVDLRSKGAQLPVPPNNSTSHHLNNEKEGWSRIKGDTPKRVAVPKSNFEAIKSRIQEASKAKKQRFDERIIERKPQQLQDVDLRTGAQPKQPMEVDDTSQDALDSSIKTIMVQAQEQLDNQSITPDQYQSMVQQVIQLNEAKKIQEAERMEKRNGTTEVVDQSTSDSDSEEDVRDFRRKKADRLSHFQNRGAENNNGQPPQQSRADSRWGEPRRKPWENNMGMQRPPGNWGRGMPPFGNRGPWMNGPGGARFMGGGPPRFPHRLPPFGPPMQPPPHAMLNQQPSLQMVNQLRSSREATIKIDNVNREIRFYGEVAIVFMDWDQPKEIGFQPGTRRITCDDQWSMNLSFNAPNVSWIIEGRAHQVRLGAPTRELYIDNEWYECYIGDPCRIELDGKVRTLVVDGPPPQVRIGDFRGDLVAGKINIIIDAKVMVPVYLDAREQQFEVDGCVQTIQFADYFLTVLLNKEPIHIEFGGLPKSFFVNGQKHFMRLTALPPLVAPGQYFVQGMVRTQENRHVPSPPAPPSTMLLPSPMMLSHPPPTMLIPPPLTIPPPMSNVSNGLDMLTNILPGLASPQIHALGQDQQQAQSVGYNLENNGQAASNSSSGSALGNVNVSDLFQKLLATGILGKTANDAKAQSKEVGRESSQTAVEEKKGASEDGKKKRNYRKPGGGVGQPPAQQQQHPNRGKDTDVSKETPKSASSAPILTRDKIIPVDLSKPATIKARQLAIVQEVYLGMQCSSCGVRFPPEQTMKYSQHLDWHFRQNRRDRDSVRKAHSRKWFYDVNNWIQYEEIEDLEEREKNWFETQQSDEVGHDEANAHGESVMPSCPAGSTEGDKICEVCHEPFDQFYNEETEEWHLRPAIRAEERVYHPICYEDYKLSLTLDESRMAEVSQDSDEAAATVKTEVKKEEKEDVEAEEEKNMDQSTDNDDDVIVMPMDAPSITEILDDDEEEAAAKIENAALKSPAAEDGDSNGEASMDVVVDTSKITMPMPGVVHIKSEPNDDGYNEEDAFMDVGTIEPIDDSMDGENGDVEKENGEKDDGQQVQTGAVLQQEEESVLTVDTSEGNRESPETIALDSPLTPATGNHSEQLGMEGNAELLETVAPVVSIAPNKIRINISKLASASLQTEGNTDSRDSVASGVAVDNSLDASHGLNKSPRPATPHVEIEYELKETIREVNFRKMETVANGMETSGLCSIM